MGRSGIDASGLIVKSGKITEGAVEGRARLYEEGERYVASDLPRNQDLSSIQLNPIDAGPIEWGGIAFMDRKSGTD